MQQFQAYKFDSASPRSTVQFVSLDGEVQIDLPIDKIAQKASQKGSAWTCLVATFISADFAAPDEDQEFQGTYSLQMTAQDDRDYNILDQANGGFSVNNPSVEGDPF